MIATAVHVMTRFNMGGGEQRLRDIVEAFPEVRHHLITGEARGVIPPRVDVTFLPGLKRAVDPWNDIGVVDSLRRRLRSFRSDIAVISHFSKAHLLAGAAIASLPARRRRRMVVSLSMSPTNEPLGPWFWRAQRTLDRLVQPTTIAVGKEVAVEYEAATKSPRVRVVRTAIDLRPFLAVRSAHAQRPQRDVIEVLFVGTLEERKGLRLLPAVTASLTERLRSRVHVRIAGDGPLRTELDRCDWPTGVTAELLGYSPMVPELMASSDVLILPSRTEGLSQVLVQAAAVGLPFASTPVPGSKELLTLGAGGVVARDYGAEAFADAVVAALQLPPSPAPPTFLSEWHPDVIHARYREILPFFVN